MSARSQPLQHLDQLINYLIAGATHIERQHFITRELERNGHDAAQARQILKQLQELQAIYVSEK